MPRFVPTAAVLMSLFVLAGCGGDDDASGAPSTTDPSAQSQPETQGDPNGTPSTPVTDAGHSADDGHDHSAHQTAQPTAPPWPKRETIAGNWVMRSTQVVQGNAQNPQPQVGESPLLLVKITPNQDSELGTVERITGRGDFEQMSVDSSSVTGDDVSCDFAGPDGRIPLTFRGRFINGVIGGIMADINGNASFVRFVPTEERTFARLPAFNLLPAVEMEQFKKLATSPVPDQELRELVKKFPSSPLITMANTKSLMDICNAGAELSVFEQKLKDAITIREVWGERASVAERFNGMQLAVSAGYQPEWCLEQLDELAEVLEKDESLASLLARIEPMRDECNFVLALSLLEADEAEEREKGRGIAQELLKTRRHHPVLTSYLADAARMDDQKDEALKLYAELVALPMQERQLEERWRNDPIERVLPTERLGKLWAEINGGSEGLDEFIQKTYRDRLVSFPMKEREPREDAPGNRTVLIEMFTGVQCPYSVAPEVAFRGLAKTFPESTLVRLRYHVHMAGQRIGHDPLTNADTEGRYFNFYKTNLTPRIFLDGITVQGAEGLMVNAETSYKDLTTLVERLLEQKTDIAIELAASQQEDTLQISCTASGIGEDEAVEIPETARLRLVIAESGIALTALNGFREHDMVARKVIGGDLGIGLTDGKLTWEGTVNLEELRTELHNYVTQYEASVSHQFDSTPLDLTNLSVVAIVQESTSRKVLQCSVVHIGE